MADDTSSTDAQDTGNDAQAPDAGANTATQSTGGASTAGLTQAQVDDIVTKRLAKANAKYETEKAELQAKLDAYASAEQAKADAEKTELQKLQEAQAAADARAQAAEAKAQAGELRALRAEKIAANASLATLPAVYKAAITGGTEEELDTSIAAVLAAFEADKAALLEGAKAPPQSIGTAGHAGAQTTTTKDSGLTLQDIQKLPSGQREQALTQYLARPPK